MDQRQNQYQLQQQPSWDLLLCHHLVGSLSRNELVESWYRNQYLERNQYQYQIGYQEPLQSAPSAIAIFVFSGPAFCWFLFALPAPLQAAQFGHLVLPIVLPSFSS